jgi:DNA repair exonuclease SbcCD ATPase subunit
MADTTDMSSSSVHRGTRSRGRLSVFEHAHEEGGLSQEAAIQLPVGSGAGEKSGHLHKSELMSNIAQSFSALEESEKRQTEALLLEEEHSRKRYIAQFQSLARKIDNLYEEARASQQFRDETAEVLKNLRRQQQALMEEIEQMRAALRDLDRLVRANLPTQLEALAALAKDIQAGLKSKADLGNVASDTQALEARIQRAEQAIASKAEWGELRSKEGADMGVYATVDHVARAVAGAINELSQSQSEYQNLLGSSQEAQDKQNPKGNQQEFAGYGNRGTAFSQR